MMYNFNLKLVIEFCNVLPTDKIIYDKWVNKCRMIAKKLKIQVDYCPHYEGKLVKGLMNLDKKMIVWKTKNPKLYDKYNKIISELMNDD